MRSKYLLIGVPYLLVWKLAPYLRRPKLGTGPGLVADAGAVKFRQFLASVYIRGRWNLSHVCTVEKAYPNVWLIETLRQKVASDKERPHWFDVKTWIKLT